MPVRQGQPLQAVAQPRLLLSRIAVMRDGRIEQIASPHEIFAKPANLFVASFIGTPQMNLMQARYDGRGGVLGGFKVHEQDLPLPLDGAAEGLREGVPLTLGSRPRAFVLAGEPEP